MNHQVKAAGKEARFVGLFDPKRTIAYEMAKKKQVVGDGLSPNRSVRTPQWRKPSRTRHASSVSALSSHRNPTALPCGTESEKPFSLPHDVPQRPGADSPGPARARAASLPAGPRDRSVSSLRKEATFLSGLRVRSAFAGGWGIPDTKRAFCA